MLCEGKKTMQNHHYSLGLYKRHAEKNCSSFFHTMEHECSKLKNTEGNCARTRKYYRAVCKSEVLFHKHIVLRTMCACNI